MENHLKSAHPLVALNRDVRAVIGGYIPTTVLRSISGDKHWFDSSCRKVYDAKQTDYHAWSKTLNTEHLGKFLLACAEAQRVYGAARKSHTLKHSTCSHKWWEILKGSIFGVKSSIPALRGPGVVWWWILLRKP